MKNANYIRAPCTRTAPPRTRLYDFEDVYSRMTFDWKQTDTLSRYMDVNHHAHKPLIDAEPHLARQTNLQHYEAFLPDTAHQNLHYI